MSTEHSDIICELRIQVARLEERLDGAAKALRVSGGDTETNWVRVGIVVSLIISASTLLLEIIRRH
jgi:hypothetical protein